MKLTSTLLFLFVGFCLAGCEKPNIQGNVFVVKGGGDIKAAAGRTIYLIPEKSEEALFSRAISEVTPTIMEAYKTAIEPMCPSIKKAISKLDVTVKERLQGIESSGSIPPSGCASLQDDSTRSENTLKGVKSKYLEKVAGIELELKALESKRTARIRSRANSLKKEALKKLSARLIEEYPGDRQLAGYSYKVVLTNNTDYYLRKGIRGDFFAKG